MNQERIYDILLAPVVTEKSTMGSEFNQVTFRVSLDATKPEIKEAVEKIYDVEVKKVSVLNVKGKVKRSWKGTSRKSSWKKAYVSLAAGNDIDFS